ncbi:tRNA (adenosine(37)-N6)-dimethylallyltransferase MiaA, partial [Lacticaseibacillus rhamnosus]|nr:tRNA (adenosine(37)-N6)-dimethylallyltransferase MiaA [Lacticaseibacillus rhamnosus]
THWFDLVAHPEEKTAVVALVRDWLKQPAKGEEHELDR